MADIYNTMYNPDVLSCIANLSNDEVFTPPSVANAMLDLLPQELFSDPDTKFLDPACKSGVFLREIAKRLLKGLEPIYPDLQERTDHIFKNQLFGIAITELTSHLSRRSLYCSKTANGNYSVVKFDTVDGNVRFKRIEHKWGKPTYDSNGKAHSSCVFCGANKEQYDRGEELETHAYEMIHTTKPEEIFKMKFDVIIGNPPYQLSDGGNGVSAKPIYQHFVTQAQKLSPRYLVMITPSRWFSGGKGLGDFREKMLKDTRIRVMVDYINAKDCFPENSISGGVNYFLWDRDYNGKCTFTTVLNGDSNTEERYLGEFNEFVRFNKAVDILRKIESTNSLVDILSSRNPFGLPTSTRGNDTATVDSIRVVSSKGIGYIDKSSVTTNEELIDKYKVMISRITYEHAGEPDKDGTVRVLSKSEILEPDVVCTDSYIVGGSFNTKDEAENLISYLKCKFTRFLILQTLSSINLSRERFCFVPMQDFSKPWTDEELYEKYGLTDDETAFIESMIKPME